MGITCNSSTLASKVAAKIFVITLSWFSLGLCKIVMLSRGQICQGLAFNDFYFLMVYVCGEMQNFTHFLFWTYTHCGYHVKIWDLYTQKQICYDTCDFIFCSQGIRTVSAFCNSYCYCLRGKSMFVSLINLASLHSTKKTADSFEGHGLKKSVVYCLGVDKVDCSNLFLL